MRNIVILQQIVPDYRVNFFNELYKNLDFELYVSKQGLEQSISTVSKNTKFKINIVKKINFFNFVIFQFIPFKKLFSKEIIIFEFNIRILSNILLLIIRIFANKKNILWTHGITENMSLFSRVIRIFFFKKATSIIVYENSGKNNLVKLGIAEENIYVSKNSIDNRDMIKRIDNNQKKFRITFIGRIIKDKNVDLLCSAFLSILNKLNSSIVLTIIGNGDELKILKKKFTNNRIEFIGHLNEEKKISYYLNQTLFTVSPDYLGLAIIHSFSYSIPILVNKNPNIEHSPEIELFIEDQNGWYFDGTQESLRQEILKCIDNIDILRKFGLSGLKKVKEEYGIENMSKCFLQAIEG